jgi:hypothetical protein
MVILIISIDYHHHHQFHQHHHNVTFKVHLMLLDICLIFTNALNIFFNSSVLKLNGLILHIIFSSSASDILAILYNSPECDLIFCMLLSAGTRLY